LAIEISKLDTSRGKLQYNISGNGKPNIVLINGGSGPIEGWMKILPEIPESSSVFSYNRFGVAGSDKPKAVKHPYCGHCTSYSTLIKELL